MCDGVGEQPLKPSRPEKEATMATTAPANITTIARFPEHFFLENLAVRADGSILVTVLNRKQLWYVPAPTGGPPVTPVLVPTFEGLAMGVVATKPDTFSVPAAGQTAPAPLGVRAYAPGAH